VQDVTLHLVCVDTEKEAHIGLQPSPTELSAIRQGFGSLFWHYGKSYNEQN
jgi:hypothetical protein